MSCSNPDMQKLINLYQFGFLSDDQKIKVEAHLLECKECLKELYRMSPTLELLNNKPEYFLDTLQSGKARSAKAINLFKKCIQAIHKMTTPLISLILLGWKHPIVKIAVPVVVTAFVLLFIFLQPPKEFTDLAILEKSPYESIRLMGPQELSDAEKILKSALEFYEKDDYTDAISQFHTFLEYEPDNPYAHFYLGVSLHLTGQLASSSEHLIIAVQFSSEQGDNLLLEKSYWHLGNVYLKNNNEDNALQTFQKLVEMKGSFEEKAQSQINRIIDTRNKKLKN